MQEVHPFIQLFQYELGGNDCDAFQNIIMNVKNIQLVSWYDGTGFVAFVCKTDHPEGIETIIEDYGDPVMARNRYHSVLTLLGANDGTAIDREKAMRKTVEKNHETDEWLRGVIKKAKAAGYDPFKESIKAELTEEKEDEHE